MSMLWTLVAVCGSFSWRARYVQDVTCNKWKIFTSNEHLVISYSIFFNTFFMHSVSAKYLSFQTHYSEFPHISTSSLKNIHSAPYSHILQNYPHGKNRHQILLQPKKAANVRKMSSIYSPEQYLTWLKGSWGVSKWDDTFPGRQGYRCICFAWNTNEMVLDNISHQGDSCSTRTVSTCQETIQTQRWT